MRKRHELTLSLDPFRQNRTANDPKRSASNDLESRVSDRDLLPSLSLLSYDFPDSRRVGGSWGWNEEEEGGGEVEQVGGELSFSLFHPKKGKRRGELEVELTW